MIYQKYEFSIRVSTPEVHCIKGPVFESGIWSVFFPFC